MSRLTYYAINNIENKLLDSYLTNGPQANEVSGATSSFEMNGTGVAQGSILSPVLLNLYINYIYYEIFKTSIF